MPRDGAAFSTAAQYLFAPRSTWRVRWNKNTDTPLPPEEPAGQNPPDGAIINYWLPSDAKRLTLEILDGAGRLVRQYDSTETQKRVAARSIAELGPASEGAIAHPKDGEQLGIANGQYRPEDDYFGFGQAAPPREGEHAWNFPRYWIRPAQALRPTRGFHRFVWDLHHAPPKTFSVSFPIAATYLDTAPQPQGPWVMPGTYTVRLTIDGTSSTRPLVVRIDPRVKTSIADLQLQFTLSMQLYEAIGRTYDAIVKLDPEGARRSGSGPSFAGGGGQQGDDRVSQLRQMHQQMLSLYDTIQDVDVMPTTQVVSAARALLKRAEVEP
jgi:hypothetical protein